MSALLRLLRALLAAFRAGGSEAPAPTGIDSEANTNDTPQGAPSMPGSPAGFELSSAELTAIMPRLTVGPLLEYLPHLQAAMSEFQITTPARAAAFLAQLAHESSELTRWEENLNYSAAALLATFPSHFDAGTATAYARQPERIANRAYANRMGNGPEESGDGWRYRGRGPLGLTGRLNYRIYGQNLSLPLEEQPEQVATPQVGFRVAGRFWTGHGLNDLADAGDFEGVTRAVNGGLNGLADRERYYAVAQGVFA